MQSSPDTELNKMAAQRQGQYKMGEEVRTPKICGRSSRLWEQDVVVGI